VTDAKTVRKLVDEDLAKSLEKLRSLTSSTKPLDKVSPPPKFTD